MKNWIMKQKKVIVSVCATLLSCALLVVVYQFGRSSAMQQPEEVVLPSDTPSQMINSSEESEINPVPSVANNEETAIPTNIVPENASISPKNEEKPKATKPSNVAKPTKSATTTAKVPPAASVVTSSAPTQDNSARIAQISPQISALQVQLSTAQTKYNSTTEPLKAALAEEKTKQPGLKEKYLDALFLVEHRGLESDRIALFIAKENYFGCNNKISETESKIVNAKTELDNSTSEINGKISSLQKELDSLT